MVDVNTIYRCLFAILGIGVAIVGGMAEGLIKWRM
jgi:hypothetical protein